MFRPTIYKKEMELLEKQNRSNEHEDYKSKLLMALMRKQLT
jgi:hypothetical protein